MNEKRSSVTASEWKYMQTPTADYFEKYNGCQKGGKCGLTDWMNDS